MGTKTNPGRFDCYANALPDEPLFVLLARDPAAPKAIEVWAGQRAAMVERGDAPASDYAMLAEAIDCARAMMRWRQENMGRWRREAPPAADDRDRWRDWQAEPPPPEKDVLVAKLPEGWWSRASVWPDGSVTVHGGRWTPTHWRFAPALPLPDLDPPLPPPGEGDDHHRVGPVTNPAEPYDPAVHDDIEGPPEESLGESRYPDTEDW